MSQLSFLYIQLDAFLPASQQQVLQILTMVGVCIFKVVSFAIHYYIISYAQDTFLEFFFYETLILKGNLHHLYMPNGVSNVVR